MNLVATGKDAHWWDWEDFTLKKEDKKIKPLVIQTKFAQKRKYQARTMLKDLYITLRVLQEVAVLEPQKYRGEWSLVIYGDYHKGRIYRLSNFLQKGKVKCLLDGKKAFLGMTKQGKIIALRLIERCNRRKYPEVYGNGGRRT